MYLSHLITYVGTLKLIPNMDTFHFNNYSLGEVEYFPLNIIEAAPKGESLPACTPGPRCRRRWPKKNEIVADETEEYLLHVIYILPATSASMYSNTIQPAIAASVIRNTVIQSAVMSAAILCTTVLLILILLLLHCNESINNKQTNQRINAYGTACIITIYVCTMYCRAYYTNYITILHTYVCSNSNVVMYIVQCACYCCYLLLVHAPATCTTSHQHTSYQHHADHASDAGCTGRQAGSWLLRISRAAILIACFVITCSFALHCVRRSSSCTLRHCL